MSKYFARMARISAAFLLAGAIVFPPPFASACMPALPQPVFTNPAGPDLRDRDYSGGKLGLLEHTYHHQPLYIAYRYLAGKPFTATQLQALGEPSVEDAVAEKNWLRAWQHARTVILGASDSLRDDGGYGTSRHVPGTDNYVYYYNCLNSAFENAVQTLDKRVAQFGAQSSAVKDWLSAQDQVFENCGTLSYPPAATPIVIPAVAHATDPDIIRADRAYQIAAAYFYAGDFDRAETAFAGIAADSTSPYSHLAPYLVARALIRKGTLNHGAEDFDSRLLAQAETQLRAILADNNLAEIHNRAQRLLDFVSIRLHPRQRFEELETLLANGDSTPGFRQNLIDYLWMLDRNVVAQPAAVSPDVAPSAVAPSSGSTPQAPAITGGEMTDWILTFQRLDRSAYEHALQRWHESKSLPWLVAALAKAAAGDKDAADLSAAAAKIAPDSPAYLTLAFHRLRLLAESGESASARNQLEQLLTQPQLLQSRSVANQFIALRMKLAVDLPDFLRFAPRIPSELSDNPNPADPLKNAPYFDTDAAVILTEKLPLPMLAEAAKSSALPPELRRQVVIAAWTRAIVIDDQAIAHDLVPTAQELVPEIKEALADYASAPDIPARQFSAVFTILHNPGLRPLVSPGFPRENPYRYVALHFNQIDSLRDNWWCTWTPSPGGEYYGQNYFNSLLSPSSPLQQIYPGGKIGDPSFLTTEDRAQAAKEQSLLQSQPAAPNWLGKQVLAWAAAHPQDPRVPEALHLVVSARRYGCADSSPENYSKPAFTLLHKQYPDSLWTKKTPYWFQ
jgi:hypothetical protein